MDEVRREKENGEDGDDDLIAWEKSIMTALIAKSNVFSKYNSVAGVVEAVEDVDDDEDEERSIGKAPSKKNVTLFPFKLK